MKQGWYTAYCIGRNHDRMILSSCPLRSKEAADGWAEYMNSVEDEKPKCRRRVHFVFHVPDMEDTR